MTGHRRGASAALFFLLLLGALPLLAGCGGSETPPPLGQCERDPELLAREDLSCVSDDACPCGMHCEFARCTSACTTDSDCGAGVCDDFGRCREEGDLALVPAPPQSVTASIEVLTQLVRTSGSEGSTLSVRVLGDDAAEVRFRGRDGALLRCAPGGELGESCVFNDVPLESTVEVEVQRSDLLTLEDIARVEVATEHDLALVSVLAPDAVLLGGDTIQGVYQGEARLVASGMGPVSDPGATETVPVAVPLSAEIFGATGAVTIAIADGVGAMHPSGELIGTLDAASGALSFPAASWIDDTIPGGDPVQVATSPIDTTATFGTAGTPIVRFTLTQRFAGILPGDAAPFMRWEVLLERVGDPSTRATPAVPPDATLPSATEAPLAWAAAFRGTLAGTVATPGEPALVDGFLGIGDTAPLDVCALDTADLANLGNGIATRAIAGTATGTLGTVRDTATPLLRAIASDLLAAGLTPETTATLSADVTVGDPTRVPCAIEFTDLSPALGGCGTRAIPLTAFDACEELAERHGCVVETATSGDVSVAVTSTLECGSGSFSLVGVPRTYCRMPSVPPACAELALCAEVSGGASTRESVASTPLLGDALLAGSGDLRCSTGARAAGIDLDLAAAQPEGTAPSSAEVFAACEADLDALQTLRTTSATYAAGVDALFGSPECIGPRALVAMDSAAAAAGSERSAALLGRMLSRWLDLHSFFVGETIEREQIAAVFREDPSGGPVPPDPASVLARAGAGWNILFLPRIAGALDRAPATALADPDYRARLGVVADSGRPEIPLPVTILESIDLELRLVAVRLETAWRQDDDAAVDEVRALLPRILLARAMARELDRRARTVTPTPAWGTRITAAEAAVQGALAGANGLLAAIRLGRNPLGIEDGDLPLYFFSDATDPSRRFSAISDFLLGSRPSDPAWAPFLVAQASAAYDAARRAYTDAQDRTYAQQLSATQANMRLEWYRYDVETELFDYCGEPVGTTEWSAAPTFDARTCFHAPGCSYGNRLEYWRDTVGIRNLAFQGCISLNIRGGLGDAYGLPDSTADVMTRIAIQGCGASPTIEECPEGVCVRCGDALTTLSEATLRQSVPNVEGANLALGRESGDYIEEIARDCRDTVTRMFRSGFSGTLPVAGVSLPGPPASMEPGPECFRGSLGELALSVRAAQQDLEAARAEVDDFYTAYDSLVDSCQREHQTAEEIRMASEAHTATMNTLDLVRGGLDSAAALAASVKDCGASMAGTDSISPAGYAGVAVACGSAVVEGLLTAASVQLEVQMSRVEREHELHVQMFESNGAYTTCLADAAGRELIGVNSAIARAQRAATDLTLAAAELRNQQDRAQRAWAGGVATLVELTELDTRPPTQDYWLDERVDIFVRRMRLARRATYLAVRAVEYEYQQSMAQRSDVLAAETPAQLEEVLMRLWAAAGTRTIDGAQPTELTVIISLRDALLQLEDERALSTGTSTEHPLSPIERFRLMLSDPRHAVYDDAGDYAGQRVPFALVPFGTLGLGRDSGIPVLAGDDCAERLWSVNASVLGEGAFVGSSPQPFVRIELRKRNSFFSQWCGAAPDDQPFQLVSVRPSRNLFREPGFGADVGERLGVGSESTDFTTARIQAWLGVDGAELADEAYANGESSELAARGLYGDYALFLPASAISDGSRPGLDLAAIDDVLLRVDYVSVAR